MRAAGRTERFRIVVLVLVPPPFSFVSPFHFTVVVDCPCFSYSPGVCSRTQLQTHTRARTPGAPEVLGRVSRLRARVRVYFPGALAAAPTHPNSFTHTAQQLQHLVSPAVKLLYDPTLTPQP